MIDTSQVQLKTNADDPYTWEKMETKEHLFSENISNLSTGQLKELCNSVDKSFVAVWKSSPQPKQDGEESVRAADLRPLDI